MAKAGSLSSAVAGRKGTDQHDGFGAEERLRALSSLGDPLELLRGVVDFEAFRPGLEGASPQAGRNREGWPRHDLVVMFRIQVLQALYALSDKETEYQLCDRLSFARSAGLAPREPVPDAEAIRLFREQLARAGALAPLFACFDAILEKRGYCAVGGQIVDATVVEASRLDEARQRYRYPLTLNQQARRRRISGARR
jgi:transposase, IS5 family